MERAETKYYRDVAPRKCSDCGIVKKAAEYSEKELIRSLPGPSASIDAERFASLEQWCRPCEIVRRQPEWDANWKEMQAKYWPKFREFKSDCYDLPDNKNFSGIPHFPRRRFCREINATKGLVGTYEILYLYGEKWVEYESRTLQNTFLTLEIENNDLMANITFDQENKEKNRNLFSTASFTLNLNTQQIQWKDKETDDYLGTFLCKEDGKPVVDLFRISAINERIAMPWLPKEVHEDNFQHDDDEDREEWLDPQKVITFESLEKAEEKLKEYENDQPRGQWLCNHKGLSPDIARRIFGFVAWKPRPVLFFESGDLVLDIGFIDCEDGNVYSCFVARQI